MVRKNERERPEKRKKLLRAIVERYQTQQCKLWRRLERNLERCGFTDDFPKIGQLLIAELELKRCMFISRRLGTEFLKDLSQKQREVTRWYVRGHGRKAIADRTGLGLRTVDTHLERARQKCSAHSKEDFAREIPLLS